MRHLIIGNGPAGVMAAEMIRRHAPCDGIVLLGNEPGPAYSRNRLPRMVRGDIGEAGCYLRAESDHFYQRRIEQRCGRIARIDTRARMAIADNGLALNYDRLLIATGASPRVPKIPGNRLPGVRACWSLQDARKIAEQAKPGVRVVLIGAGLVGCSMLEPLVARKVNLHVVEQGLHMAPGMLKSGAARMLKRWCESKGVHVHVGTTAVAIDAVREGSRHSHLVAHLANGERLVADMVLYAIGSQPNIAFAEGSGIDCGRGILVNPSMQTSVPEVYAAGDCAETFDIEAGRTVIAGVLPNALDQACCAALNMVGKSACQQRVRPISVLSTMGLEAISLGDWRGVPGGQWVEASDEPGFKHLHLEFHHDILVGANAVGLHHYAGLLRDLIHHQVPLGQWKERLLKDPTRLKEAYGACVRRHSFIDDRRSRDVRRATGSGEIPDQASPETIAAIAYRTIANAARRPPPAPRGSRL